MGQEADVNYKWVKNSKKSGSTRAAMSSKFFTRVLSHHYSTLNRVLFLAINTRKCAIFP